MKRVRAARAFAQEFVLRPLHGADRIEASRACVRSIVVCVSLRPLHGADRIEATSGCRSAS